MEVGFPTIRRYYFDDSAFQTGFLDCRAINEAEGVEKLDNARIEDRRIAGEVLLPFGLLGG